MFCDVDVSCVGMRVMVFVYTQAYVISGGVRHPVSRLSLDCFDAFVFVLEFDFIRGASMANAASEA